jgi:hypothetical protein
MVDRSVSASGEADDGARSISPDRPGMAPPDRASVRAVGGPRLRALAARLLWLAAIGTAILLFAFSTRAEPGTSDQVDLAFLELVAVVVLFASIGGIVATRRPESYAGWLMLAFAVAIGSVLVLAAYGSAGLPPATRELPGADVAVWAANLAFVPILGGFATLFLLYFPNGRLLSPRWRLDIVLLALVTCAYVIGSAFMPGEQSGYPGVENPFGAPEAWATPLQVLANIGNAGALVAVLAAVASVVLRYRSASRLERYQIRWIALLGIATGVCFSIAIFQVAPVSDIAWAAGFLCFALLPIAIGVAITRYHLYDIDEIINRTIVYGALTAILAGLFTASITLSQRVFSAVTGERSDAAIVVTTLVVVSAYTPVRKWLEALVDRRFKFETPRFGAYRAQLRETLDLIDPEQARDRLVREVVRELGATGGAIVAAGDGAPLPSHVAGDWTPHAVVLSLPIPDDPLDERLELTARPDGRQYADREVALLEEVLVLVSRTMGLLASRPGATPGER